jgi:hypothetical protein
LNREGNPGGRSTLYGPMGLLGEYQTMLSSAARRWFHSLTDQQRDVRWSSRSRVRTAVLRLISNSTSRVRAVAHGKLAGDGVERIVVHPKCLPALPSKRAASDLSGSAGHRRLSCVVGPGCRGASQLGCARGPSAAQNRRAPKCPAAKAVDVMASTTMSPDDRREPGS